MKDLIKTLYISVAFARADIVARFSTAKLGIHWFYVQQIVWAFGAGSVWSVVFGIPLVKFLPFIMVSFPTWNLIASFFVDASASFQNSAGYLKNTTVSPIAYVLRPLFSGLFIFFIGMAPVIIYYIFVSPEVILQNFGLAIISVLAVCVLLFPSAVIVAYYGVLIRDLTPALQSIFQVLFIVSPVIYPPEVIAHRGYGALMELNPFYHYIQIIREPLLSGKLAPISSIIVVLCLGLLSLLYWCLVLRRKISRVAIYV